MIDEKISFCYDQPIKNDLKTHDNIFIYIYIYRWMNRWTFKNETEILNLVEFIRII